jgi:serine protease Do
MAIHGAAFAAENSAPPSLQKLSDSFKELSQKVEPAVVHIRAVGWSGPGKGSSSLLSRSRASGSGVILDPNGYIITNAHVIEEAQQIQVSLANPGDNGADWRSILKPQGQTYRATLVGLDYETDLALLKIPATGLSHLELANSDDVEQGHLAFAFGSPLGLENSVTMGIISSVARQLKTDDPMIYIQTDAAINPGNSGGPLVNTDGKVIGINTFIMSQSGGNEGIGFAAPSNIVKAIYRQLKEHGRVRRGEIGVNAQTITPELAKGLGLSRPWGVILGDVYPGSPADKGGLEIGDIILTLNGKQMENGRQFDVNLYSRPVGETVSVRLMRGIDTIEAAVEVMERPGDVARFADLVTPSENQIDALGILGLELNDRIREMLPSLRRQSGVLVAARSGTAYSRNGSLHAGDVIYAVNKTSIAGLANLRRILSTFAANEKVTIQVERDGRMMYVVLELQ